MSVSDVAITVLLLAVGIVVPYACVRGVTEVQREIRRWRVQRELTAVDRARERELREWYRGW